MTAALARRELGTTGLEVSVLGFGGAGIGNLYRELADEDALAAVRESFASGVRYFDTAPFYGFGLSELRIGTALAGAQPPPVISTKVGRRLVPTGPQDASVGREGYFSPRPFAPVFDYGYDAVMRSHAESLERLEACRASTSCCATTSAVSRMARPTRARVREFLDGGYRAMRELRQTGAVRAIGLGVNETEVCVELLEHCELDCILLAGRYTLLEQPALRKLLPLCVRTAASRSSAAGPFNSGILAAGSRAGAQAHYNYAPPPAAVLERVRRLEALCEEFDVPLQAAALQFPLAHPAVATVVAGCANGAEARNMRRDVRASDRRRRSGARCASAGWSTRARRCPRCPPHDGRIDSHQHFWRLDRGDYGWLTPPLEPIYRDYLPADLAPQLARAGVDSTVLVQAAPTVAETRFLLELATEHAFIAGVVGWVDFESPHARPSRSARSPPTPSWSACVP